jgi:hypothetical protein
MTPQLHKEYLPILRVSAKNNCTILLGLWPICCVALKAAYLDMQPSMRLADEPNPGAIRAQLFFAATLNCGTGLIGVVNTAISV